MTFGALNDLWPFPYDYRARVSNAGNGFARCPELQLVVWPCSVGAGRCTIEDRRPFGDF